MQATMASRPTVVTPAASEPLTLTEAKKQVEVAAAVTLHDNQLTELISEVRDQWERDTDSIMITQTLSVTFNGFYSLMRLPVRPVTSITSISYYDGANDSQSLSTGVYELDAPNQLVRLQYNQNYPTTASRWDAVTITFVAGYATAGDVPPAAKRAMLLQIGKWFNHTDMTEHITFAQDKAYKMLVDRFLRSTYP